MITELGFVAGGRENAANINGSSFDFIHTIGSKSSIGFSQERNSSISTEISFAILLC